MIEEIEIWKDVPDYEGLYQVSNFGNVKSLNFLRTKKHRLLKITICNNGYLTVGLSKNLCGKKFTVHVLVAMAFLNHKPDGTTKIVVDHINNIKIDNRLVNLQLISHRENSSKDQKNRTSNYIGVSWNKKRKKWLSMITFKNKGINLGYFKEEIDASNTYQKAKKEADDGLDLNIIYPKGRNKSSKYKWVYFNKTRNKWQAKYKGKSLGYYFTELEAHQAVQNYIASLVVST
jgi:hypothetical protein